MSEKATLENGKWKVSLPLGDVAATGVDQTIVLNTKNKYVDSDIEVEITADAAQPAELAAAATASATISSVEVGLRQGNNFSISGSATISGNASATTETPGYASTTTQATGSVTGTANLNATIPAAAASVSLSAAAAKPTVAIDSANDNILASTATTTKPSSGYYAAVKATAPATTLSGSPSLTTAGYINSNGQISASGSTTATTGVDYYVPIAAGALDNTATDGTSYTENTSVIIPSEGALYINEGYYPATKITLDQMLDGKDDTAGIANSDIRTGAIAYDVNGKKLTGTMGNASVKSGEITHTFGTPTYNSTTGKFDQSCEIAVTAPTVSSAGYISAADGTKEANSKVESHSLDKIELDVDLSGGNLTVAPTLARTAKPSGDTWTDAASGDATTTKPTSGAYVQIDAAAATNTVEVAPIVTKAGYGDASNYDATPLTGTVGAAQATTAYVPIATGSRGTLTNAASATGNILLGSASSSQPASGYYIKAHAAANEAAGTTGWTEHSARSASNDIYYPVAAASLTHNNTATETPASVAVSGSRSSNLAAPGSDTTYYVTINGSATAGNVRHSASVSEGYVPAAGLSQEAIIPTSASVSGNGNKVYLKSTSITNTLSGSATSGYSATLLDTAPSAPYITLVSGANATAGAVYNGTATTVNKYIPIFDGDYTIVPNTPPMPEKGDIITMNLDGTDKEYLVLNTNDSVAEVLARDSVNDSIMFNSGSCFVAGTQVLMADGSTKNIEDVVVGDRVISYNIDTQENYETIVKEVITRENAVDIATLTLEDNTPLTMTAYHPIYTKDGWHSITGYNDYPELVIGDKVKVIDGYKELININRYNSEPITVYSIDVVDDGEDPDIEINDNFYANNVMVHNPPVMGSNTYSGGELDTYLNTTYYNTLSADAKSAIIDKNLIQYQYNYNGSAYDEDTHVSFADYSTKSQKAVVGDRHIYAPGIEDVEEYFNNEFSTYDVQEMFNTTSEWIWLSSAHAGDLIGTWRVDGSSGDLGIDYANCSRAARPAFQIDLSKVSWS